MSPQSVVILGAGVFGEEVKDLIDECSGFTAVAFAQNRDPVRGAEPLHGLPVYWVDDLQPFCADWQAVCAIGSTLRSEFVGQVQAMGFQFATIVHPHARVSGTSSLGPGTILSVASVVASHTTIGRHVIVNRGCLIGHHTRIDDHVTLSPGVNIGGRTRVEEGCYVGMGATILNDITVGGGAIIGAGAVVTRDVPPRCKVVGVPARVVDEGVDPM